MAEVTSTAGTETFLPMAIAYGSLILLAGLSLYFCSKMLEKESAVFRS